ncbi:MAG: S-layer homology domain-containing protein [Lachnospiraceae bacterium]|nr:S-layer homology domain-containing protein [Lachnospiraceae bacterium]
MNTSTLTACRAENGKVVYFKLTPGEPIAGTFEVTRGAIRSISLAETEISVVYGETREFPQVTYEPEETSDEKTVLWSSSDEAVLGAAEGQMQGLNPGKAVLTAAVPGRDVSAEAGVRVLFSDVTDPEAWYFNSVYWALDNRVTSGYGKGTFQPTAHLTRAQVVGFLYNMAGRPDVSGLDGVSFTDVGENDWYYNAARWAVANKITSGYGQGTFRPNASCTRAMIVTFIKNYAEYAGTYADPKTTSNFSDVAEDAWYKEAVDWAVANGITSGYGEGTFSPDVTCNRAMMVAFLRKAAGLPKV